MNEPDAWIKRLGLLRHPEGGWYRETYRSSEVIPPEALPTRYEGERPCATAIYFLIGRDDFSALHRLASDEIWHFYAGDPLAVHVITREGIHQRILLGRDPEQGEVLQAVVSGGDWFGARVEPPGGYALVGCTVAPGFDFRDFELARREELAARHPAHAELIRSLTR